MQTCTPEWRISFLREATSHFTDRDAGQIYGNSNINSKKNKKKKQQQQKNKNKKTWKQKILR